MMEPVWAPSSPPPISYFLLCNTFSPSHIFFLHSCLSFYHNFVSVRNICIHTHTFSYKWECTLQCFDEEPSWADNESYFFMQRKLMMDRTVPLDNDIRILCILQGSPLLFKQEKTTAFRGCEGNFVCISYWFDQKDPSFVSEISCYQTSK